MRSCITMSAVASLLLAAGGPNPGPENASPVPGWSFATEGSGIPRDQDAAGFAAGVDREVAHRGHASVSIRSIVAEPKGFRAVTQLIKADAYRGKRVRLAGYLKTRDVSGGWAGLWLRVDGPDAKLLAIDNMGGSTGDRDDRLVASCGGPRRAGGGREAGIRCPAHGHGPGLGRRPDAGGGGPEGGPGHEEGLSSRSAHAERASNLDFEATGAGATDVIPGWRILRFNSGFLLATHRRGGSPRRPGVSGNHVGAGGEGRRGSLSPRILPRAPTEGSGCGSGRISRPRAWPIRPTCGCDRTRIPGCASSARWAGGRRGRPTGAPTKWSSTWPPTPGD